MKYRSIGASVLLIASTLALPSNPLRTDTARAQVLLQQEPRVLGALDSWGYQPLYEDGWSAQRLFEEATIYGPGGDALGTLKNIILDRRGGILGVIAEVGGFLGIGDTNIFVPWDEVTISTYRRIYIPVTEENLGDYGANPSSITRAVATSIREVNEDAGTGRGVWKATELINDYVYLGERVEYGYVRDLIFNSEGQLYAYVVSADASRGGGYFALPYESEVTWDPDLDYYNAPFGEQEVRDLQRFDYTRMNEDVEVEGGG